MQNTEKHQHKFVENRLLAELKKFSSNNHKNAFFVPETSKLLENAKSITYC